MKIRHLSPLLILLLIGCTSVPKSTQPKPLLLKEPDVFSVKNELGYVFDIYLTGNLKQNHADFLNFKTIYLCVLKNDTIIDSIKFSRTYKPVTNGISMFARTLWMPNPDSPMTNIRYRFDFSNEEHTWSFTKKPGEIFIEKVNDGQSLFTIPFVDIISDSSVEIGVDAIQKWKRSDEKFPTSEEIRVEIFSEKGAMVWNTYENMQFMQMLTQMMPDEIGNMHRYSIAWDGNKLIGGRISPGKYKARIVLPARPKPYIYELDFDWKTK